MLRRRFIAALGLAPAALIPAAKAAEHTGPLVRGITFEGTLKCDAPCQFVNCTAVGNPDAPFRIVAPVQA